jgi:hypothetical protein
MQKLTLKNIWRTILRRIRKTKRWKTVTILYAFFYKFKKACAMKKFIAIDASGFIT